MFGDEFNTDWESTKTQDAFIKNYFGNRKVSPDKILNTLANSLNKSENARSVKNSTDKHLKQDYEYEHDNTVHIGIRSKRTSNDQPDYNVKKKKSSNTLLQDYTELHENDVQFQRMQLMNSDNIESDSFKKKKKEKNQSKKKKNHHLNEFSKQINDSEDLFSKSENATTFHNWVVKESNLREDNSDCNCHKMKKTKTKKKIKNSKKISSECNEFSIIKGTSTDIIPIDSLIEKSSLYGSNSDCTPHRINKKIKGVSEKEFISNEMIAITRATTDAISCDLSMKKNSLFQNKHYQKLQAAKFRYLNEMLYTNSGKDALSYFQQNTDEFQDYHLGYQSQLSKWPINPVDIIIQDLSQINKPTVIADLGCGEAKIAEVFPKQTVHSFDLIALKKGVIACDIASVPLKSNSVDVVVFCLSLMGTNWKDYLKEGHRILKLDGILKIAEIESRFENVHYFIKNIENYGFSLINQNSSHKMFVFLNFKKISKNKKSSKVPEIALKPCLYKKR